MHTVLLVNHNGYTADIIRTILEAHGHVLHAVADADEAVDFLTRSMPDVVITAFSLRVSAGQTLTEVIRSREEWRGLPIVNLTADALDDVLDEAIAAGVNVNLIMPVEPAEILRTVVRLAGATAAVPGDGSAF